MAKQKKASANENCKNLSKKWVYFNWFIFGVILLAGFSYATTITETSVTSNSFIGDGSQLTGISSASSLMNGSALNNGLRVLLGFDENGLTTNTSIAYNAIRSGLNGTFMNSTTQCSGTAGETLCPTWTDSVNYYGVRLNRLNGVQVVALENSAGELYNKTNLTVSYFFRVDGPGETTPNIFAHSSTGTPGNRVRAFLSGTGHDVTGANLTLQAGANSTTNSSTNNLIFPNKFYHVGIVYNFNVSASFYLNGELLAGNQVSESSGGLADFILGANDVGGANAFNGTIDEFRIYNRVLSATEIRALSSGLGGSSTGHLALR